MHGDGAPYGVAALPPLAGVPGLTELRLAGAVLPLPDLRQLASLPYLALDHHIEGRPPQPFAWGSQPLTALTALTRIDLSSTQQPGARRRWGMGCQGARSAARSPAAASARPRSPLPCPALRRSGRRAGHSAGPGRGAHARQQAHRGATPDHPAAGAAPGHARAPAVGVLHGPPRVTVVGK